MIQRITWLALALALFTLLAGSCQTLTGAVDALTSPVTPPEESRLVASGTIQAQEVRISSELGGRILEVRVDEGTQVRAGELLVTLDATPWLIQLSQAEAAIVAARSELALVAAGPRVEEIAASQAALDLARAQRDSARTAWASALNAINDPQELDAQIAQAHAQVQLAEQGVELAEAELAAEMLLRDQRQGFERDVADLQVRAAEEALAAAETDLVAAQRLLNWLWMIRQEPLHLIAQANAAEGRYDIAQAGVSVALARLDDLLAGPTAEEIDVAEAAVRRAQAEAEVLRVQVDQCTLISPLDGVVLHRVSRGGELAAPAATILTVADLSTVTLVVYVPENRVGEVALGQAVSVSVDSFPGRDFPGTVTHIGDQPEFTPRNVTTVEERLNTFYAVELTLPNPEWLLKPGMPADAQF
jgi:HlyD family secretion protein